MSSYINFKVDSEQGKLSGCKGAQCNDKGFQEGITIINVYDSNKRGPKYVRQKLIEFKEKVGKSTITHLH